MNCYADEIEDKVAVGRVLVELYQKSEWDLGWSVIDTVIRADSSTILVSNSCAPAGSR